MSDACTEKFSLKISNTSQDSRHVFNGFLESEKADYLKHKHRTNEEVAYWLNSFISQSFTSK